MSNDGQVNLQACISALEELQNGPEDAVFSTTYKNHLNLLQSLYTALNNKVEVSPTDADRVLKICLRYTTDVRCVLYPYVLSIISDLIDIDKDNPLVDFLPFALAILEFLNTMCLKDNTSKLRILSLQVLMKHPKSTLIKLTRDHSPNIIQTFERIFELNKAEDLPSIIESFKLLSMLEWLPAYEKGLFVETGLRLWFAGVIPAMMQIVVSAEDVKIEACLTYTELLAKELVLQNYDQNPHWKSLVMHKIANPNMFPASIIGLIQNGKDYWHRIWIVLIKILKSGLTGSCSPSQSRPINEMLPVVQSAFKKESAQRVRAFACWNELIDNLSEETGNSTEKRIKLLIIPLKTNNAKTEETAQAKFQTWWHFIHKFRPKIQNFTNEILISFLHFMFGSGTRPQQFQAKQVSDCLRKKCIDAFAEIMHVNCSNCAVTNLKRLDVNITTPILLTDHWKDFVYALKSCIWAVAESYTKDTKSKIQCIWISFVMRLAAMPEDSLRRDMFDDLINILSELILENETRGDEDLREILVEDIILPLWRDNKLKTLTESRSQSQRPMHRIVKLIMKDQFNNYFNRFNSEELTRLLQPLISSLLEESTSTPEHIIWLLDELLVTNITLIMWTALAQASKESKLSLEVFNKILLWPFKTGHVSFEVKEAAKAWYTLYNIIHENLEQTDFDSKISKVLTRPVEDSKASNYFVLFALIGVLKHKPDEEKMAKLEALTYEMNDYNDFEQLLIPLVNTIELMINNSTDENLAQITINCMENILKVIKSETEPIGSKSPIQNRENSFSNLRAGSDTITSILKTYLEKCPYQSIKKQVRRLLSIHYKTESPKKVNESPIPGWDIPPKEFTSPKIQEFKKSKNNKASIETTTVENGEEYVVVTSNWKFNPKNLTENQREKLKRKRDIPALYQDLSQSQDEFKLTSWKTDSQDTSLSSSRSTSNDVSSTLTKITNPDIVPKIMENIYGIEKNSKPKTDANVSPIAKVITTTKADELSTPGVTKSPRVALKDRIYRNVRNLIRNSSPSPQDKETDKQEEGNILQNVSKSPVAKPELVCKESPAKKAELHKKKLKPSNADEITTNKPENGSPVISPPNNMRQMVVSTPRIDEKINLACTPVSKVQKDINLQLSAPRTLIDRPARLKKTPKKFDESLLLVRKRRNSKYYSQDFLEGHTETTIPQIHNPNDKMDATDAFAPQKVSPKADTNENAKKSPTTTDDLIIVQNVTSCAAVDDKSSKDIEKTSLNSPKTSTNKPTAKSPEKPTGRVPSNMSQASEGVDTAQNETYDVTVKQNVKTTLSKPKPEKELHKAPVKRLGAQLDPEKNTEKVEAGPINKTKKDSNTRLPPLSKPQEPQNTPKKVGARHDVKIDNTDTPNISPRKYKKSKVQKEIDDNAAVNTPVTTDQDFNQPNLSAIKKIHNDTDKNVEKVEVVPVTTNETKKDSDTSVLKSAIKSCSLNENEILSNTLVKTKETRPAKMRQKKIYNVVTENIKDDRNLSITPKTQKRRNSRIEKELAIDMIEGHPFLKTQFAKRLTRKTLTENGSKRKTLIDKLNKAKLELTPKTSKKDKKCSPSVNSTIIVEDSQDKAQSVSSQNVIDEPPCSEDVIESSQDSTMTTVCVKAKKRTTKRIPVVALEKITLPITLTQYRIQDCEILDKPDEENHESTDIELPQNKSVECDTTVMDLTENMDTEPVGDLKNTTDLTENMDTEPLAANETVDVIILSETLPTPVTVNSESEPVIGPETQELAEADTQPNDPKQFEKWEINKPLLTSPHSNPPEYLTMENTNIENDITQRLPEAALVLANMDDTTEVSSPCKDDNQRKQNFLENTNIENNITQRLPEAALVLANMDDTTEVSSPCKDDNQRKQNFLNNTVEISPIKVQSPDRQIKSPSPDTSRDFVVIQLSSPVHSNGEPFDKQCSPEFFTEDKVSQDKQNASPPWVEVTHTNSSPSASLSLKKNRPCRGRAAQMFGLLSMTSDIEIKQLPAKPGLRFNNLKNTKNDCTVEQNPSTEENYLELQRSLPSGTNSPSGPILKRKFIESIEESPASAAKKKRVSFHDPPVSTTVSVQKYIEPISLMRSPQSSAKKRQTRLGQKSPKKLDNAFLASALSKTVESFTEATTPSDETENISLDITPAVEIVKTSELNDTDPICRDLIDCTDPIDVIAIELSSAAMRDVFVKELEGKVDTVGDLAKMTELEVNRLCIKAPKITVAKKVLTDYITNRPAIAVETVIEEAFSEPMTESAHTQTEIVSANATAVQTIESGCKTEEEILDSCISYISQREDLLDMFKEKLNKDLVQSIAESVPAKNMIRMIIKKKDESSKTVVQRVLKRHCKDIPKSNKPSAELTFLKELIFERYGPEDLTLFSTDILHSIYHKPA